MDRRIKIKQHRRDVKVNKKRLAQEKREAKAEAKAAESEEMTDKPVETTPAAEKKQEKKRKVVEKTASTEGEAAAATTAESAADEDEDQFDDEIEKEDFVTPEEAAEADRLADAGEDMYDDEHMGMGELQSALKVWDPKEEPLKDGEELIYEPKAYDMLHRMTADWPSLSFDVMRDSLGIQRKRYPHTMLLAAGTQADIDARNKITLMRVSSLCSTKHDKRADEDSDESDSEDEDENEEDDGEDLDEDPVLETRDIHHHGTVNRLRCNKVFPHLIASWSSTGKVNVYDVKPWYDAMNKIPEVSSEDADEDIDDDSAPKKKTTDAVVDVAQKPFHSFKHKCEGYALDWNPHNDGTARLLTGDCSGAIYLWHGCERAGARGVSAVTPQGPFLGHRASVEDLQWSPAEPTIFASCSSDCSIRIWDARVPGTAGAVATASNQLRVCEKAHAQDVNVISWNALQNFLLASGSDDGSFRVWDLRSFQDSTPVSDFRYHTKPITSIEWSPFDESTIAVSSADNTITIWDLSLESDTDEAAATEGKEEENTEDVPPQLMFVHMGQTDIKEIHWHPQILNTLLSTALDGFNVLKPANL